MILENVGTTHPVTHCHIPEDLAFQSRAGLQFYSVFISVQDVRRQYSCIQKQRQILSIGISVFKLT